MSQILTTAIIAVVLLGLLALMWWGWRRRSRTDRDGIHPAAEPKEPTRTAEVYYVATTRHSSPLERVNLPGLRYRAKALLTVAANGVRLDIPGENPAWLPAEAITGAGAATYTIDRVVEQGGLICVSWRLADRDDTVDSYLRVIEPGERDSVLAAITAIIPTSHESEAADA